MTSLLLVPVVLVSMTYSIHSVASSCYVNKNHVPENCAFFFLNSFATHPTPSFLFLKTLRPLGPINLCVGCSVLLWSLLSVKPKF